MKALFGLFFLLFAVYLGSVESHPFLKLLRTKRKTCPSTEPKRIVCYVGSWSDYRPGKGKFNIDDIDPKLCTHIIYSFALPTATGKVDAGDTQRGFEKIVALKKQNPKLKVMLAAGGYTAGTEKFSKIAGDPKLRATFVDSVSKLITDNNFDGFDLDWEYPNKNGNAPNDKENLNTLLKDLKQKLSKNGKLLSIAVGMGKQTIQKSYDIKDVAKNVDFINAMTYDFKGPWDGKTGHHTNMHDVEESINTWIDGGAPPEKINLGTGFYGKSYKTQQPSNGAIGVPSSGAGDRGPYTGQAGLLGYNEICEKVNNGELKLKKDKDEPVAYNKDTFVAFDTPESVGNKNEWAKENCLGGGMVWSIDTDDFHGNCGKGKFPLLQAMNKVWKNGESEGEDVPKTDNEESEDEEKDEDEDDDEEEGNEDEDEDGKDETPQDESGGCQDGSLKAHPGDRTKYYWCVHSNWMGRSCPPGTVFHGTYCGHQ